MPDVRSHLAHNHDPNQMLYRLQIAAIVPPVPTAGTDLAMRLAVPLAAALVDEAVRAIERVGDCLAPLRVHKRLEPPVLRFLDRGVLIIPPLIRVAECACAALHCPKLAAYLARARGRSVACARHLR